MPNKRLLIPDFIKIPLIVLGIILAVFVYSFWGSKLDSQNKDTRTAEAYGLDSLYAEPEPIMEIRVWQRNEKETLDYPEEKSYSNFFFNILPLELKKGETVETTVVPRMTIAETVIEVEYDGDIQGYFDISSANMINYTGESDIIPANYVGGSSKVRMNDDATFSGNRKMTLNVINWNETGVKASLAHKSSYGENGAFDWIQELEHANNFSYKDYYRIERFHEAYPETPIQDEAYMNLRNYKRVVMTNYLTIQAMHPTKPDTPVATAVLEVTTYSSWYGVTLNNAELEYVFDRCDPNCNSGKVTVISYEQSDFFAME